MSNIYELTILDDCVPLIEAAFEFYSEANLPIPYDEDSILEGFALLFDDPNGVILTDGEGSFLGGRVNPTWINKNVKVAQEMFWWAKPGKGPKLLEAFEEWAWTKGADHVLMVSLPQLRGEVIEKLYKRKGYAPFERSYVKEVF